MKNEASLTGLRLERYVAELCLAIKAPSAQSAIIILLITEYHLSFQETALSTSGNFLGMNHKKSFHF